MEEVEYPVSWSNNDEVIIEEYGTSTTEPVNPYLEEDSHIPQPGETPTEPAFEDQNFGAPTYITLARIYDLLAVIALKIDPDTAERVLESHEAGKVVGAPPSYVFDDDEEDDPDLHYMN